MEELIRQLRREQCSCVIRQGSETRTFHRRGVADLYDLYCNEPEFLRNAEMADKVVGKGAAALMVAGGVKALYAETLSLPALTLLANAGICTRYGKLAPFILNRTKTGWCPLENLCQWESNPEELIRTIRRFVRQQGLSPAAGEVREEEKSYSEND